MTPTSNPPTTRRPHWTRLLSCPAGWHETLNACGGGFFHTPLGQRAGAPAGDPLFYVYSHDGVVAAAAVGVGHACRLSARPRHAYFPSPPAMRDRALAGAALSELFARLRLDGYAEVTVDSFDAPGCVPLARPAAIARRQEYTVPLSDDAESLLRRCAETHRRHIRRGDRSAWGFQLHTGITARRVIDAVLANARARAAARGAGFASPMPDVVDEAAPTFERRWGVAVCAAWNGAILLSAAMVGWGLRSAYCVMAGSSDAGYTASASTWLQHRIMVTLGAAGFVRYNLGGASPSPGEADAQPDGLQRFKLGFGAVPVPCESAHVVLRPLHARGHELRQLLSVWDGA